MHSVLVFLIIAAIVAIQVSVARNTSARIDFLKQIIPGNENFETVTAYVPENQIKNVSAEYILQNLEKYSPQKIVLDTADISFSNIAPAINPENNPTGVTYDTMIWVVKEKEKKEIPFKLLRRYEQLGWEQIK